MRRLFPGAPGRDLFMALVCLVLFVSSAFAGWSNWAKVPNGAIEGEPSVVVTKNGNINVMARGTDSALWWTYTIDGGKTWKAWSKVGGILTSSPSCTEPIANVIECYVRNSQNGVSQIDRINNAWGAWADVGGILMSNVASASPSEDQRYVFGIATTGKVAIREWRGFGSMGWLDWWQISSQPGIKTILSCGAISGNSTAAELGTWTDNKWACILAKQNGTFALIRGNQKDAKTLYNGEKALQFSEATAAPMSVFVYNLGESMDIYFVAKDKQMKRAIYNANSGWKGSPEQIGNGVFTTGASCDSGPAKHKITRTCAGRGTDGAVWIAYRSSDK